MILINFLKQRTVCNHCNHYKFATEDLTSSLDLLDDDELALAKQCSQICFTASSTSTLLSIRNKLGLNLSWTESQMRYLSNKDKEVLHNLSPDASTAENLINSFASRNDVNFLYVTFHPSYGMTLLTGKLVLCMI